MPVNPYTGEEEGTASVAVNPYTGEPDGAVNPYTGEAEPVALSDQGRTALRTALTVALVPEPVLAGVRGATAEGVMAVGEGATRIGSQIALDVQGGEYGQLSKRLEDLRRMEAGQADIATRQLTTDQTQFGGINEAPEQVLLRRTQERETNLAEQEAVQRRMAEIEGQSTLGQAANAISQGRQAVREALPVSEQFQASLPGQISQGIGQAAGTLPFYVIPGIGQVMGPATSVAQLYQEGYDDAIRSGADPALAHQAAMTYIPAASLDVIGDRLVVGRVLKPLVGQPIKRVIADVTARALSEGATETGQQAFLNYIAAELAKYDPERPLTDELRDSFIVGTVVGGVASGGIQAASEKQQAVQVVEQQRQQTAQVAQIASAAVEQAAEQVATAQQTLQTTRTSDAASISEALENPEAATLDDMEAKQRELAEQAKTSQAATQQASQTLQQASAALQEASGVEQRANMELAEHELLANQILSQPGILPGGNLAESQQPTSQAEQMVGGVPVLPEAQPAQVGPVSLAEILPAGELQNAEAIAPSLVTPGEETGTLEGEAGGVRLRDLGPNQEGQGQVLNAGQAAPAIQPVEVAPALASTEQATLTPVEPQVAPEGQETAPVSQPASTVTTTPSRGLIVGSKTEAWADRSIAEAQAEGRLYTGLDPKLSFAYAVKGAALIEQGIRDFAAWSAEMTKRYATLTAENLTELFQRATEMAATIKAGEPVVVPPEVRGALISTEDDAAIEAEAARQNNQPPPTPDSESIENAEAEGIQSALADPSTPAETKRIITTVLGQDFTVDGRRQWTAGEMQRSRNHARGVFAEAGIEVVWDSQRGIYRLADSETSNEAAGRKLVEILKREFGRPRVAADPLFAVLVNSIRSQDGGMWVSNAFSPGLRNELFSVAQGEASFYGLMLGALASAKRTLSWVATHVDTVLHKAYSDAFGGNTIATVLTKVADEIQKQTGVDPRNPQAVAKEKDKVAKAKRRALDAIKKVLTVQQKRLVNKPIKGKKSLWMRIEEAVDAGVFDNASILQEIAQANGWEVPTPVQLQRLKDMAEREKSLRDTPERAAATKEERYRLMREMQTLWSRFSRPITWRTPEGRKNLGAAGAEYLSANMLLKAGFWVKQPIDVSSQVFWHVPTRALASAAQIARNDKAAGRPTRFWQDAGSALASASKNLVASAREAVVQFQQGLRGRGELRNVEGIIGTINAFDRLRQRADELAAQGDHGRATVLRMISWIQFSFRLARALDNAQGTFIVGQELRERIIEELRSAGRNPAQAAQEAETIIGDRTAEVSLAMGRAKEILDAEGIEHNQTQLTAAAFELYRARQFERIKAAGLDADQIAQSNERLRQTVGWNMPERRGIGGAIGGSVRNIGRALEDLGLPLPIGRFGNAIAIGINRALTWTPAGFFPSVFGGEENAWFKTAKDRTQRKMEAATGSALGAAFIGMALSGMMRVWNKGPDDPEDRELWEKEGHRPGTVEFHLGNGQVISLSLSTGPISYMRGVLGGIGVMQDVQAAHEKRARSLAREAERRGLQGPPQEGLDANDLLGALAYGGYQAVLGGRTAGGAIRSTIGSPESVSGFLRSFAASQTSPFVPLLPALQEVQRARGVRLRYNMADFSDLLLPTHEANGARRNFLNDPLIPSLQQSVVQTLTGGTYGPFEPGKDATKPYRIFHRIEYRPDGISRTQGFEIGNEFRPLSDEEWKKATAIRGDLLKAELEGLSEYQTDEDLEAEVRLIAPLTRREALDAVGAR